MADSRPALAVRHRRHETGRGPGRAGRPGTYLAVIPTPAGLDAEQLWRTLDALITDVLTGLATQPIWPAAAVVAAARWSGRQAWFRR